MPLVFILLAAATLMYCTRIPPKEAVFLAIISVILLATAMVILISIFRSQENTINLEEVNLLKVLILLGALVLYAALLRIVGYLPCTLLLGIFVIRFLGYRHWGKNILFCIFITALTFGLFRLTLGVPLPMGMLFN